jgi:hypothetical protein
MKCATVKAKKSSVGESAPSSSYDKGKFFVVREPLLGRPDKT